jgi:hypothetical protein
MFAWLVQFWVNVVKKLPDFVCQTTDITSGGITRALAFYIIEEVGVARLGLVYIFSYLRVPASTYVLCSDRILTFGKVCDLKTYNVAFCIEVEVFQQSSDTTLSLEFTIRHNTTFVFGVATETGVRVRNTLDAVLESL